MADGATDVIAEMFSAAIRQAGHAPAAPDSEDWGRYFERKLRQALAGAGLVVVREADQLTAEDLIVAESWGADRKAWEDEGAGIDWTLSDQTALVNLRRCLANREGGSQ